MSKVGWENHLGFDVSSFVYGGHIKELANNLLRAFRILRKRIIFA